MLAATVGGWLDQGMSRLVDVLMAIPALIFALLLLTIFGTSILTLILVIAVIDSTRVYRLARSVALNIVVMDYIEAAKLRGEGLWRLITREILPNMRCAAGGGVRAALLLRLSGDLGAQLPRPRAAAADWPTGAPWCARTRR